MSTIQPLRTATGTQVAQAAAAKQTADSPEQVKQAEPVKAEQTAPQVEAKAEDFTKYLLPSAPGTFIFSTGHAYHSHDGVIVPANADQQQELEAAVAVGNLQHFHSNAQLTDAHEIRDPAKLNP